MLPGVQGEQLGMHGVHPPGTLLSQGALRPPALKKNWALCNIFISSFPLSLTGISSYMF